jgi:hypothetical protein
MRLMSFALTTAQLLDGSKTVTRRVGWENLVPGQRIKAVKKAMGLKKGEAPEVLAEIEVVSVRRERLDAIDQADCVAEGFPHLNTDEFVDMFCKHMKVINADESGWSVAEQRWTTPKLRKMRPDDYVTRIEFRVVPRPAPQQLDLTGGAHAT